MPASVTEQMLSHVQAVLTDTTAAADNVFRGRVDALGEDEVPGLNIVRGNVSHEAFGAGVVRLSINWTIEHTVCGADAETLADALHVEVDARLQADPQFAAGLLCVATDYVGDAADQPVGRLTAHYQLQILVRRNDLTRRHPQ